jgi:hypothetical protein
MPSITNIRWVTSRACMLPERAEIMAQAIARSPEQLRVCRRLKCGDIESRKQSLPASAAVPGVRARVAPGCNLGQPAEVMSPAFRMAGVLHRHRPRGQPGQPAAGAVPTARPVGADLGRGRRREHHAAGTAGRTRAARHRGALHRLHRAGCVSEGVHRNRATLVTPTVRFTLPICLTPTKHHPTERTDDDTHDRDA